MLIIICGEDTSASRDYFNKLKKDYFDKGYYLQNIVSNQLEEIPKGLAESQMLFSEKKIFTIENLDKNIKRRKKGQKISDVETIHESSLQKINDSKDIILLDWEDGKSLYDLKIVKLGTIKEFKPASNIFKLTESCYPGNMQSFITNLNLVNQTEDEQFIFIMLIRQIHNLILACSNGLSSKVAPWQKAKLFNQAKLWKEENLIKFYEGLHRIDISIKTGLLPNSIKNSLEILAIYFLK